VLFDYDQVESNNYFVKVRGMNSTTTGPFSDVASYIGFVPAQVADNIQQDAQLLDNNGNLITAFLLSQLAAWAFAKAPEIGNILAALGLPANTITTSTGASASDSVTNTTFSYTASQTITRLNQMVGNIYQYSIPGNTAVRSYDASTIEQYALTVNGTLPNGGNLLQITVETPLCGYDYVFQDGAGGNIRTKTGFLAQPAFEITILNGANVNTATQIDRATIDWNNNKNIFTIAAPTASTYWVVAKIIPTYDLNMYFPRSDTPGGSTVDVDNQLYLYDFTSEGDGLTVTYTLYQ
jgi:hypothetical protein